MKDNTNQPTEQPNAISTLLAASGLTVELLSDLLNIYMNTDENGEPNASISQIVNVWRRVAEHKASLENLQAACASGAVAKGVSGGLDKVELKLEDELMDTTDDDIHID